MNANDYHYAVKIDIFKAKLLDPQQKRVNEAEAIMNDQNYQWKDEAQKNTAKARLEEYKAWLLFYKNFYEEGLKFAGQHERMVDKLSKWYDTWFKNISNEGVQETEMMKMQADMLNEIFCEMYKELEPLKLEGVKPPAALNIR